MTNNKKGAETVPPRPPVTVYWRNPGDENLSYDDALTMQDAEKMKKKPQSHSLKVIWCLFVL